MGTTIFIFYIFSYRIGDNMSFTLNDLIKECELAIPMYREIAEDEGMSGDIDLFDYYDKEANKLEKLIEAIRKQLVTNQIISIGSVVVWLNSEENKTVKEILMSALELVRDRREYQMKKIQEEVDFCNQFLNCRELRL